MNKIHKSSTGKICATAPTLTSFIIILSLIAGLFVFTFALCGCSAEDQLQAGVITDDSSAAVQSGDAAQSGDSATAPSKNTTAGKAGVTADAPVEKTDAPGVTTDEPDVIADAPDVTVSAPADSATQASAGQTSASQVSAGQVSADQVSTDQTSADQASATRISTTAPTTAPPIAPKVSLHLSRSEYPRVDGSTATIPLSIMLARAVTGMSQNEAENFVSHTKTTESFYNLALENNDLLIVYAPPDTLFDDLNEYYNLKKSSFIMAPIGRDALIFLVNDQNPVKSLTHQQLVDIYSGAVTDWSELTGAGAGDGGADVGQPAGAGDGNDATDVNTSGNGGKITGAGNATSGGKITGAGNATSGGAAKPASQNAATGEIIAFQRNEASGSQVMMENLVMRGTEFAETPPKRVISEMEMLVDNVAEYNNSGNAIGYSVYYYFNNMYNVEGVRALEVDGIPCTNETIRDGSYPYVQNFYAVIRRNEASNSATRKLFNLIISEEGAALIDSAGYVSIRGGNDASRAENSVNGMSSTTYGGLTASPDASLGVPSGASPDTSPGETGYRPADTLATIKRKPASSPSGGISSDSDEENIFPLSFGDKIGFINADGELVVEPIYDSVQQLFVSDGFDIPQYINNINKPIYYSVKIQMKDENGANDNENAEYTAVLGPSGMKLYESVEKKIDISSINLKENSIIGNRMIRDEWRKFIAYSDGSEAIMAPGDYFTDETFGNNRIVWTYGWDGCFLTDAKGMRVSNKTYDSFYTYNADVFIFGKNGRLIAVNSAGKEVYKFPADIQSISWDEATGLFIYSVYSVNGPGYNDGETQYIMMGLMDSQYNKTTDALWAEIVRSVSGDAFIVVDYTNIESAGRLTYLINKDGKRLTDRDYFDITTFGRYYSQGTADTPGAETPFKKYLLAYFNTPSPESQIDINKYSIDFIDIEGNILLTLDHMEELTFNWAIDNYISFSILSPGGESLSGLKTLADADKLNSPQDGWLIPPIYDTIWYDNDINYIIAYMYSYATARNNSHEDSAAVYDTVRGKMAFTGNFRVISFYGYKNAGGSTASTDTASGIFYAETATRKGYLNDRGEWIASLSRFDNLEIDG